MARRQPQDQQRRAISEDRRRGPNPFYLPPMERVLAAFRIKTSLYPVARYRLWSADITGCAGTQIAGYKWYGLSDSFSRLRLPQSSERARGAWGDPGAGGP